MEHSSGSSASNVVPGSQPNTCFSAPLLRSADSSPSTQRNEPYLHFDEHIAVQKKRKK